MNEAMNRCENSIITTRSDLFLSDETMRWNYTPRLSLSNCIVHHSGQTSGRKKTRACRKILTCYVRLDYFIVTDTWQIKTIKTDSILAVKTTAC